MKCSKRLAVLMLLAAVFLFSACGGDAAQRGSPLVGRWVGNSGTYIFNQDGTGTVFNQEGDGTPVHPSFGLEFFITWSADDGRLMVTVFEFENSTNYYVRPPVDYAISDGMLTIFYSFPHFATGNYTRVGDGP